MFGTFQHSEPKTELVVLGPEYIICYHRSPWIQGSQPTSSAASQRVMASFVTWLHNSAR